MNPTAWLDQRAAGIRDNREGQPVSPVIRQRAETTAARFPELDQQTLGAVLITWGALLGDAWTQLEQQGVSTAEILESVVALTDVTGEYLYAPEDGTS